MSCARSHFPCQLCPLYGGPVCIGPFKGESSRVWLARAVKGAHFRVAKFFKTYKKSGLSSAFPNSDKQAGCGTGHQSPVSYLFMPACHSCGDSGLLWIEGRGTSYCSCKAGRHLVDDSWGQDVFVLEPVFFGVPF